MESERVIVDVFGRWCYEPLAKYDTIVLGRATWGSFGDPLTIFI